ncbi:Uncharcterized protein, DUF927 family [Formivibrio citricus]|uniref:Uncharcterized protein, DUF927 family n=1 Tax=Formivibrio citricus TaxID=83765 RepID=A0A1I4VL80_9NEIS|nr:DUF927 domain-containing protein [Formivibrio citricus]SFN01910.1 Uncharcterized protein, DUF927 family [Formivibrio citricus]
MTADHDLLQNPESAPLVDQPQPSATPAARPAKAKKPPKPKTATVAGDATFVPQPDGVYIQRGDTEPRKLCGPLEIVAQLRDANGSGWCVLVKLTDLDGQTKTHQIPRARLVSDQSTRVIEELAELGLWLSSAKDRNANLMLYLQTGTDAPRARKIERTGWHESAFVLPDEVIGPTAENLIYQGAGKPPIALAGTLEGWRDGVAKYAPGNPLLLLALGAGFAGPLVRLTGLDSGGFHFYGDSKAGKSTICDMAASIWGNPKDYRMSWKATAVGIEYASASYNDLPFLLDEINLAEPREVDSVVYLISQGKGKARGKDSGGLRDFARWCCFAISNGEQDLATVIRQAGKTIKAGQAVRLLSIPARRSVGAFDDLHGYQDAPALCAKLATTAAQHHGAAGQAFLARLTAEDMETKKQEIRRALHKFAERCVPEGASAQVRHAAHYFALAGYAAEQATLYGLTGWDLLTAWEAACGLFEDWLAQRGGAGNEEDRQIIRQVQAHFEQHGEGRYADLARNVQNDNHAPKTLMRCGFRETETGSVNGEEVSKTTYYVLPQAWTGEVLKGFDPRKANRLLVDLGILLPGGDGKASRQKAVPGMGKPRVYWVSPKLWEWGED